MAKEIAGDGFVEGFWYSRMSAAGLPEIKVEIKFPAARLFMIRHHLMLCNRMFRYEIFLLQQLNKQIFQF